MRRELSEKFMFDLLNQEGILNPILISVQKDQTLMLAIWDGFINIYYRGGSILELTENNRGEYRAFFNNQYNKSGQLIPTSPDTIKKTADANNWVNSFLYRKNIMDESFTFHEKSEREFQQLVARENNNSSISNESDYFIADIEVSESSSGGRFDMLAIKWPTTNRKSGNNCRIAFIEMKFGDRALDGNAGMLKHLKDMDSLITNKVSYSEMTQVVENQFNQLDQLELLKFNKGRDFTKFSLDPNAKPELIFILANHNPRAKRLKRILGDSEIIEYSKSQSFDLRFFVASFAGYGLHEKCMLDLSEFSRLL